MVRRTGVPSRSFKLGERVRAEASGQRGYVTGFRICPNLGFRFCVIWDKGAGYSLATPEELVPERLEAAG